MRRIVILVVATAIGLLVSEFAHAAGGSAESYNITLRSGEMAASSVIRNGGQRSFIFDFSPGRSGVKVGGETPNVDLSELWPSINTGDPNRDPDLVLVLKVTATSQSEDRIAVSCQTTRLKRIRTTRGDHDYRMENGSVSRLLERGEPWEFLGGTSPDGHEYYIEMTIAPERGSKIKKGVSVMQRIVPIEFNYEMYDRRVGDTPIYRSMATIAFDPAADEPGEARFEVPITMPGSDSSAIHMTVSLKDIYVSPTGPGQAPDIEATFRLDRMLITNIVPGKDPNRTEVRDGKVYMSDFQRSVSLRYGKRVRIGLARQEKEDLPESIKEFIEVRSLREE